MNQLGAALHLGFMKVSGCALDAFEMVPRTLLVHLGRDLGIDVPTVTSVRALYRRRSTLFEYQRWAADTLGFCPPSEHQRRALTGLIKQESYEALTTAQLVGYARRWCYEHKLLIPGERTLNDLVRTTIPQAEQELLGAIEKAIPAAQRSDWLEYGLEQVAEAVNTEVISIEKDNLSLEKLEAEPSLPEVEPVRNALFGDVGTVQFPELIMEIDSHTRFSSALLGREPTSWNELLTLYAALLARGTDLNAAAVSLMIPQISATAISDYMMLLEDGTALRLANDSCVAFMRRHPITRSWGEGTLASSNSMSLDATRHLFSARIDPKRQRRGIGIYTHKLDQWPLIYDQPIVLMQRQSGAVIEG